MFRAVHTYCQVLPLDNKNLDSEYWATKMSLQIHSLTLQPYRSKCMQSLCRQENKGYTENGYKC